MKKIFRRNRKFLSRYNLKNPPIFVFSRTFSVSCQTFKKQGNNFNKAVLLRKKEKKKKKDAVIDFAKKVDSYLFKNQLYLNHKCKDPFLKVLMSYINMID